MMHTKIINLRRTKFISSFSKNRLIIMLTAAYILGLFLGVLFLRQSNAVLNIAQNSFKGYVTIRTTKDFFGIMLKAFTDFLPTLLILFLSGTSVVGIALAPIGIGYCGFRYGITAGFLYKQYLIQGIAFNSLILIPCTVFSVIGYFIAAREALKFSFRLVRISLPKGQAANIYDDFKLYCIRFIIIILIFILSSAVDAAMSVLFLKYFSF